MIRPTVHHRIPTLDVVRGFAVLGILLANVPAFAFPVATALYGIGLEAWSAADAATAGLVQTFVTGKFRSTLAILFGVGVWLQHVKRSAVAGNWPGGYLKRTAWLFAFGVAHGVFIWFGDILATYAIAAFATAFLVHLPDRTLKRIVIGGYAVMGLVGAGMLAVGLGGGMDMEDALFGLPTPAQELAVFGAGTWFQQVGLRAQTFGFMFASGIVFVPFLLPLFVLGVLLARRGALARPSAHPRTIRRMLIVGFGLGLPLNLLGLYGWHRDLTSEFAMAFEMFFGPLMAPGYLAAAAVVAERSRGAVAAGLAAVGRMSLSVYLLQSVLATFVFYSWGLGWFGKAGWASAYLVVPPVWLACVAFAVLWQRRHALGPAEALWRSMTEGSRLSMARVEAPAAVEAPPPAPSPAPTPPAAPPPFRLD